MTALQNLTPDRRRKYRWERGFLAALAATGNVSAACRAAGVSRPVVYAARKAHPDLAGAWADALEQAADALEQEARRRALDGVDEPVIYRGQPCGTWVNDQGETVAKDTPGARLVPLTVKRYSDALLMGLLKAYRPQKFRDTNQGDAAQPSVNVHVTTNVTVISREQFRALPLDEQVRIVRAPGRLQITD